MPLAPPNGVLTESMTDKTAVFSWSEIPCGSRSGVIQSYTYQLTSNDHVIVSGLTNNKFIVFDYVKLFDNLPCGSVTFKVAGNTAVGTGPFGNVDYQLISTGEMFN